MSNNNSSNKGLNILIWNTRSLRARLHDLFGIIDQYNLDVMCFSETMLDISDVIRIPGYSSSFHSRDSRGGGCGISIRDGLSF